jgi:broad specificity phosphatase PhoE
MTKIILVRHGHVEGISPERFRGRADLSLTAEGVKQAEAAARRILATWTPSAIYASPLSRAVTTAEAIGRPIGLSPSSLDGMVDIDYGKWQGLTPDQVKRSGPSCSTHGIERRTGQRSRVARPFRMFSPERSQLCGR